MSAFHPAVRGILYAALTEHEQAHALAQLAADDVSADAIVRYKATIADLKRLIAITEPAETEQLVGIEEAQRAHVVLGRLIAQLPECDIPVWTIGYGGVDGMIGRSLNRSAGAVRAIADRLGIEYTEQDHVGGKLKVAAAGDIDGVSVNIWCLLDVVTEQAAAIEQAGEILDEDQPSEARGHGQDDEDEHDRHALEPDGTGITLCGVYDLIVRDVAHSEADVTCIGCLAVLAQMHTPERVDEDLVICVQCTASKGAQIIWPCLAKSALDRAADFGNTVTPPATSTEATP